MIIDLLVGGISGAIIALIFVLVSATINRFKK
jgi:hypothetical protein